MDYENGYVVGENSVYSTNKTLQNPNRTLFFLLKVRCSLSKGFCSYDYDSWLMTENAISSAELGDIKKLKSIAKGKNS